METWDAIAARRNVREYTSELVSEADLKHRRGRLAAVGKDRQAWDFVIVTNKEHLQELSTVWRGAGISRRRGRYCPRHPGTAR